MSLRQSAVTAVAWSALQNGGAQVFAFIVFAVLARLLPPEAFGLIAWANICVGFLSIVVNAGLSQALVQREALEPGHLDAVFWANLVASAVLMAMIVASAGLISRWLGEPELAPVLKFLSVQLVLGALSVVQLAILRRELRFKDIALRTLVGAPIGGVVGIAMAFSGYGIWSLVGQYLVTNVVTLAMLWRVSDWRPGFRASPRHLRELIGFSASFAGGGILRFVSSHVDQFLIGTLLDAKTLGIYMIGIRGVRLLADLGSRTLNAVSLPVLSKLQSDMPRMSRAILTTGQANGFISMPAFLGLAAIAPDFVPAAFGDQWLASVPVMQILAIEAILFSIRVVSGPVVNAMGRPGWVLGFSGCEAVAGVALVWFAAPYGVLAVAGAALVRAALILPFFLFAIRRLIGISVLRLLAPYAMPFLCSAAMVGCIVALRDVLADVHVWVRLVVAVVSGGTVYLLAVRFLAPAHMEQMQDLARRALPASIRPKSRAG